MSHESQTSLGPIDTLGSGALGLWGTARELYAAASLAKSEARVDPHTRSAALHVEIDSGPAFRFGPLQVSGTKRLPSAS